MPRAALILSSLPATGRVGSRFIKHVPTYSLGDLYQPKVVP